MGILVSVGLRSGTSDGFDIVKDACPPAASLAVPLPRSQLLLVIVPVSLIHATGAYPPHVPAGEGFDAVHVMLVIPGDEGEPNVWVIVPDTCHVVSGHGGPLGLCDTIV